MSNIHILTVSVLIHQTTSETKQWQAKCLHINTAFGVAYGNK